MSSTQSEMWISRSSAPSVLDRTGVNRQRVYTFCLLDVTAEEQFRCRANRCVASGAEREPNNHVQVFCKHHEPFFINTECKDLSTKNRGSSDIRDRGGFQTRTSSSAWYEMVETWCQSCCSIKLFNTYWAELRIKTHGAIIYFGLLYKQREKSKNKKVEAEVEKKTCCLVEVDVVVEDILCQGI